MLVLKCEDGWHWRTKKACTYVVCYKNPEGILEQAKKVGGFNCPVCRKRPLKMYKKKSPVAL